MSKYIDTDKLKAEIDREMKLWAAEGLPRGIDSPYCTLKGIRTFVESLQQEQPETPSGEEVMNMCNQILIDWVKEGKTPEEREQREQAHIRFFELYDEYMQEQPEEMNEDFFFDEVLKVYDDNDKYPPRSEEELTMLEIIARHFYELGINARKEKSK